MKKLFIAIAVATPILAQAAPAVSSTVVVQNNTSKVAAAVGLKANGTVGLGSLANLNGSIDTAAAQMNVNSIKVRGGSVDGNMTSINNNSGLAVSVGGSGNVNSIDVDAR